MNDIGIVVPTLGTRIDFLITCLVSIKEAGCKNVVLVTPEGCLDDVEIINKLITSRIDDPGEGLPAAINLGISALPASVKYAGWLGDDDLLTADSLIRSKKAFEGDSKIIATYGACLYLNSEGEEIFLNRSGGWASVFMNFLPNLIPQPGSIFDIDIFRLIQGVKPTYPLAFDFELFFELKKFGKLKYIPEIQGCFRWHKTSMSVEHRRQAVLQTSQIRKIYLPRFLKFFSFLWEPVLIELTLLFGKLASKKANKI